ncbi:tetraspanin-8-like [Mugil cephalus]|uniref:tetraspanin-8-like n=1 Tax=Mugil cephalus TaxID=48193 RepID=UPI001FB67153|nr:tetraspanin-8-like [Mugil cephalus]
MGKVNGCLKCVFIFFNLLFAIIGGVLIIVTGIASIYSHQISAVGGSGLVWCWVFAISVIGISCLGICAACSDYLCALKTFAGFMGAGLIIMLICGFIVVAKGNEMKEVVYITYRDYVDYMEDERSIPPVESHSLMFFQDKCCELMGAKDWGSDIPLSCACYGSPECKSRPYGTTGPYLIYAKGCMEIILQYIDTGLNIIKGIFFGFSAIALLGLLISSSMIHQIKRHDRSAGQYSMAMNDVQTEALCPLTSALLQEEPAVKA